MNRSWTAAAILAGIWLVAAAAAGAAPQPPSYAIGKVTVVGGNPIHGVEEGVIFQQSFGEGCVPSPPQPAKPLSTSLTASAWLALEIIGCPSRALAPQVSCRLNVGPWEESYEFQGWQQILPIPQVPLTGRYTLELSCTLAGRTAPLLSAPLYLTYRYPGCAVTTGKVPREEWYRHAVSWGSGLKASTPEDLVLRQILRGMFNYGQRHWRYGYCVLEGADCQSCRFPPDSSPVNENAEVVCPSTKCGAVCKCAWPQLLEKDLICDFGNCFVFTDIMYYISQTMGIGGMTFMEPLGSQGKGFATQPALRSLDPDFPGNFSCRKDLGCSYLFGNHSLLSRNGLMYDPTFGQIYSSLAGLIGQNVLDDSTPNLELDDSYACLLPSGYGAWTFYREQPGPCSTGATELATSLVPSTFSNFREVPATLGRVVRSWLRPRESLFGVELAVDVREGERYILESRLRSISGEVLAYECQEITLRAGTPSITVELSSPAIGETGFNGAYVGDFVLHRADPPEVLNSTTAYFQFGPDDKPRPAETP